MNLFARIIVATSFLFFISGETVFAAETDCAPALLITKSEKPKTTENKNPRYVSLCHVPGVRPGAFENGVNATWSSSRPCPKNEYMSVTCAIPDDGKVYDAEITHSSGDDQFDAECLEAICSQSAICPANGGWNITIRRPTFEFGKKESWFVPKARFDGRDVKECLRYKQSIYPGLSFVLIHRIPLSVLNRYPGLFKEDELLNTDNLIDIPFRLENWNLHHLHVPYAQSICCLYSYWSQLLKREKVTREEVLDWAKFGERIAKQSNSTYIP